MADKYTKEKPFIDSDGYSISCECGLTRRPMLLVEDIPVFVDDVLGVIRAHGLDPEYSALRQQVTSLTAQIEVLRGLRP